ncbi:MAG: cytochrome-c oxidase [Mesorhizobium sp.]|uniref:cytochrome c oxidase assembly protein n=1 Tax=Mesorhizobium sp. TaxID=1871066 RepID=UPI000FE43051|nr:cytochrome c oxidase assembly protein [Mesorhizobium sp.]RWJ04862.1 MAG: cytochrome-c oxidase [Mesorhizobium sp.]RWJ11986.1 MAG: cytochrome-c oxidase [Mesorhizobium sp.]
MKLAALITGIALLAVIWAGLLLDLSAASLTARMLAHMGVVAVAAPLVAIGVAGTRLDPSEQHCLLFSPVLASVFELVVVWLWHMPALHQLTRVSSLATVAEQASFLATGLVLWLACVGCGLSRNRERRAAGSFGLLLTSMHMTLLGALLSLAPRPLYGLNEVTCFGATLNAGQDQQLGGVVMLVIGAVVYTAGGLVLLSRVLMEPVTSKSNEEV